MNYRVSYAPAADKQLVEIFNYLADAADPVTAARYTEQIVQQCESLRNFPIRGVPRDNLMPGLRVTHYNRTAILFTIVDKSVLVLGFYHGGQNYEANFILAPNTP